MITYIIPTKERIDKFIEDFKKEKLVQKYLYDCTWISGCCTTVYPITICEDSIEIQWKSDKNIFEKFINRIVKNNIDIFSKGFFWKSDGSCPSVLIFCFHE